MDEQASSQRRKSRRVERKQEDQDDGPILTAQGTKYINQNNTKLWAAIRAFNADQLLSVLSQGNIDANQPANDDSDLACMTPLSYLVRMAQAERVKPEKAASLVKLLLSHGGADPTQRCEWYSEDTSKRGRCAVVEAARYAIFPLFDAFVDAGADLNMSRSGGLKTGDTCLGAVLGSLNYSPPRLKTKYVKMGRKIVARSVTSVALATRLGQIFINEGQGQNGYNTYVSSCIHFKQPEMLKLVLERGGLPELHADLARAHRTEFPALEDGDPTLRPTAPSIHMVIKCGGGQRHKIDMIANLLLSGAECDAWAAARVEVKLAREKMVKEDGTSVLSLQALCASRLMRTAQGNIDLVPAGALAMEFEGVERFFGVCKDGLQEA